MPNCASSGDCGPSNGRRGDDQRALPRFTAPTAARLQVGEEGLAHLLSELATAQLPPTALQDGVWSAAEVDALFEHGSASGQDNICWFHAVTQLAVDPDTADRDRVVQETTQRLRRASDLLGFSQRGAMFDNSHDGGGMHLLAHMLGVQVHTFAHHQGRLYLQPQNTAGSPLARSVYLHLEGGHFIPLWPKPASGIARQQAGDEPTLADRVRQLVRARRSRP